MHGRLHPRAPDVSRFAAVLRSSFKSKGLKGEHGKGSLKRVYHENLGSGWRIPRTKT